MAKLAPKCFSRKKILVFSEVEATAEPKANAIVSATASPPRQTIRQVTKGTNSKIYFGTAPKFSIVLFCILFSACSPLQSLAQKNSVSTAKVFILAGQSNMQGHGVVDLDDAKNYNGGRGTLVQVIQDATDMNQFAHLRDSQGNWIVRDDVWVRYQTNDELKKGGLSIGFSAYPGEPHHIGPEFQFGHVVGAAFDVPVLLIKTAWGGKSLFRDFRPPSSGGTVGPNYNKMLEEVDAAFKNAETDFPALKGHELQICGFVWQQGWNDMIDDKATAEYETNLLNLIKDVRAHFKLPELPVVIGELGNGGTEGASEKMLTFRSAQAAAANHDDKNVAFVTTSQFARPADQSPNVGHGHHWYGNAESYFLVGDALGKRMVELVNTPTVAK